MANQTLSPSLPVSFSTYRTIRIHPTVSLARRLAIAPVVRAKWALESPDATDETIALTREVMKLRQGYIKAAMGGLYDFGYVGMETFINDNGKLVIKPLLADSVKIRVDDNGEYIGIIVNPSFSGSFISSSDIFIPADSAVFMGLDVEAGFLFGDSLLEIARTSYDEWIVANEGADRYDAKIAGGTVIVKYPPGDTVDDEGNTRANALIADDLVAVLESGGTVAMEVGAGTNVNDINNIRSQLDPGWSVEYVGDSNNRQGSFIERMRYLDNLLVRSFGLPERAVLEGQHGTLAESESQSNFALEAIESTHEFVTEEFESQVLKPFLSLMISPEAAETVNIIAGPVSRDELAYKQKIAFELIKANPNVIDIDSLLDEVSVAKAETTVFITEENTDNNTQENN